MPDESTVASASRRSKRAMDAVDLYVNSGFGGDYERANKIASTLDRDAASDLVDTVADVLEAADDAEMRDVYPDVEPRVARNRLDNVDRMLQRQRLERHFSSDNASLEPFDDDFVLQSVLDKADETAETGNTSDNGDDSGVTVEEDPSLVSFVSDILIGTIMLLAGLFVTTLVLMVLYRAIISRRDKRKATTKRTSERRDAQASPALSAPASKDPIESK